ncbi:DUF4270 family protein [Chitinophaga oryziterrae]|uniref:DUF4270 family protein n=1 Tax=Chitinophaga oryziterrae TaxID=1031224 RepID=A0A6N8J9I0_9BACT|nr:DUF4270 family protein [Chitinophaga oryziterrae]MVT40879.1 DUF4270 family protein [Chitinophaga oryziterrae]
MNKSIRAKEACKYLVCALLITGAEACDKAGFSYDNIVDNGATQYIVVDSVTMNMNTVFLDSIPTSYQSLALVGNHTDPIFGTVSASSYWRVKAFNGATIPDLASYDSLVMIMRPNKTGMYGDTAAVQDVSVYRVTEKIDTRITNGYLYSYDKFATETTPLGSKQFKIRPSIDTLIRIKLDDALGADLYQKCKSKSQTVTDQIQFADYLKGLSIQPGANSKLVSSFRGDDSLTMRLYYHQNSGEKLTTTIDFPVYNAALQFNHIDVTRPSGSPLTALSSSNKLLASTSAGNRTYAQPLTNLISRIDMPYLKNISQLHKFFKVMRATLTVRPEKQTYQYPYNLPAKLTLCEINSTNSITDTLISPSTGGVQTGNLVIDYAYNLNTDYTYDITNYCIAQMSAVDANIRGLALIQPRNTGFTRFDRVVLGDRKNKFNNIEIKIYYLQYE